MSASGFRQAATARREGGMTAAGLERPPPEKERGPGKDPNLNSSD
jgi:hypothetical protein